MPPAMGVVSNDITEVTAVNLAHHTIIVKTEVPAASASNTSVVPPPKRHIRAHKRSPPTTSASLDIAWIVIPTARLVCPEKNSGKASHVVYDILVKAAGRSDDWYTYRRYSNFYELNRSLPAHPSKPILPPKRPFAWLTESFIEERRAGLEKYLQDILKFEELRRSPQFRDFIGLTGSWSLDSGGSRSNKTIGSSNNNNTKEGGGSKHPSSYQHFPFYSGESQYGMRPKEVVRSVLFVHAVKRLSPTRAEAPHLAAAANTQAAATRLVRAYSDDPKAIAERDGLIKYSEGEEEKEEYATNQPAQPDRCWKGPLGCNIM